MEQDPTRMCALLVGLPDVNALGVELGIPIRVHVERPANGQCVANAGALLV